MKRNHSGKKVIGTILLIFSFVMLPAAILAVVFYLFPEIPKQINDMVNQALGSTGAEISPFDVDFPTMVSSLVINALSFVLAFIFLGLASKKAIIKMHDLYGQKKPTQYRSVLFIPFLIAGIASFIFFSPLRDDPESGDYMKTMMLLGIILFALGVLMLIFPMPSNFIVKRKERGDTVTLCFPRKGIKGRFSPGLIINELNAYTYFGYTRIEEIRDFKDFKGGRIYVTMKNTKYNQAEVNKLKKEYYQEAMQALKENKPLESRFDVEPEYVEDPERKQTHDIKKSVNDYDIVTTYGDGHKETSHHYKDVVVGQVTEYYKAQWMEYYYVIKSENGKDRFYLKDARDNMLVVTIYLGRRTTRME